MCMSSQKNPRKIKNYGDWLYIINNVPAAVVLARSGALVELITIAQNEKPRSSLRGANAMLRAIRHDCGLGWATSDDHVLCTRTCASLTWIFEESKNNGTNGTLCKKKPEWTDKSFQRDGIPKFWWHDARAHDREIIMLTMNNLIWGDFPEGPQNKNPKIYNIWSGYVLQRKT